MRKIILNRALFVVGIVVFAAAIMALQSVKRAERSSALESGTPGAATNAAALKGDAPQTDIVAEMVTYHGATRGYYAAPNGYGDEPGVVMIHEWWGLNDGIKEQARTLAAKGFAVFAVDLYDGNVAATPEDARKYVSGIKPEEAVANMKDAVAFLRSKGATRVASLGWCFGGGQSLQLALSGEKLDATVIYYGSLTDDEKKLSAMKWPVLGVFGDKDQSITVDSVRKFEAALGRIGTEKEIYVYPGVGHAFANPSGANYAPEETKDAWDKTVTFLVKHLR